MAKSLKRAPFPTSIVEVFSMSNNRVFHLLPIVAAVGCAVISLVAWIIRSSDADEYDSKSKKARSVQSTYWLTRAALLRGVGLLYLAAFLTSAVQSRAIFGEQGLRPARGVGRPTPVFTLLGSYGIPYGDAVLEGVSWFGVVLSLVMLSGTVCTFLVPLLLWVCYLSIVNLGGLPINYGWEWLTLEYGFLAIFLSPVLSLSEFASNTPPSKIVIILYRWAAFRLLIGAGMSKVGGNSSKCWKELSCTTTHYFTQPMPNPLALFMHALPDSMHKVEVATTFFEQLVLPFFMLIPIRRVRIATALCEFFFQFMIWATGNYAWINFVGALPCVAFLDDEFLSMVFSKESREKATAAHVKSARPPKRASARLTRKAYRGALSVVYVGLLVFIAYKSTAPIKELFSPNPWLHYYDDYFFVTSQGVFGFINSERVNLVLHYTHSELPPAPKKDPSCRNHQGPIARGDDGRGLTCEDVADFCTHPQHHQDLGRLCPETCDTCPKTKSPKSAGRSMKDLTWHPLEFKNLPGDPHRAPWFNSPYHRRFDWQVWIETTARLEGQTGKLAVPQIVKALIARILAGDTAAMGLMGTGQRELFDENGNPPAAVRAEYYRYEFATPSQLLSEGRWWNRRRVAGDEERFYRNDAVKLPSIVKKSAEYRTHFLVLAVVGVHLAIHSLLHSPSKLTAGLVLAYCILIFFVFFSMDYPSLYDTVLSWASYAQSIVPIKVPSLKKFMVISSSLTTVFQTAEIARKNTSSPTPLPLIWLLLATTAILACSYVSFSEETMPWQAPP